ncbi:Nucleotidylyl transferase [Coprinopsis marcescibilis]|uniref:Nucleotidylyl transferase n=1 Tax=Coprinopsis marcescibilis TaxID=230819 RepID=A0A5C3LAU2_COPMA|nr:Nucleotidylyl transferase [Coprinopsis marcescibilis]
MPPTGAETVAVDRAILLATLQTLSPLPYALGQVIHAATALTKQRLVIVFFSRLFNVCPKGRRLSYPQMQAISHTEENNWNAVQKLLTWAYVQATKAAVDRGNILMDVTVLLKGLNEDTVFLDGVQKSLAPEMVFRVSGDAIGTPLPISIGNLRTSYLPYSEEPSHPEVSSASYTTLFRQQDADNQPHVPEPEKPGVDHAIGGASTRPPFYPVVALGGTFDHIHAGHKILLSMGAWIAGWKLIVGVTSDSLLQKKPHANLIQPISNRIQHVRDFLEMFKPSLEYFITEITDVYGPTGWDADIQALVVSKETLKGAGAVAQCRKSKDLPPLETFVIDVISATHESLDHEDAEVLAKSKLSSTFIRGWIAESAKELT